MKMLKINIADCMRNKTIINQTINIGKIDILAIRKFEEAAYRDSEYTKNGYIVCITSAFELINEWYETFEEALERYNYIENLMNSEGE